MTGLDRLLQFAVGRRRSGTSLLLPVSVGTNQSSENGRSAVLVARTHPDQERSLRKASRAVAVIFDECSRSDPIDTEDAVARAP